MKLSNIQKVGISFLVAAMLFVFSGVLSFGTASAASISQPKATTSPPSSTVPAWVTKANPYVHVSNYIATIDPAARQHLTAQELQQVVTSVAKYNALLLQQKQLNIHFSKQLTIKNGGCRWYSNRGVYWWGVQVYFNGCATNALLAVDGSISILAGLIATFCPPCMPVAAPMAAFFALDAIAIAYVNGICNGEGVYLDQSWAIVFWYQQVC